ncbi:MAG: DUF2066 domain-containing protein [Oleiphilaceae bacterium]|nr:DUF2066 domain-containing protein [Oleiphilaceae bacterium]
MRQSVIPGAIGSVSVRVSAALMLLLAVAFAAPAGAVIMDGLYQASVAVDDTSGESREKGFASGLSQVLVRLTGSDAVLDDPQIGSLLENAQSLVEGYSYDREGGLTLEIRFDAGSLPGRLAAMDQPVWGVNRPGILAWVVVEERSGRSLLRRDEEDGQQARTDWGRELLEAGRNRGLPLMLPRYDSDERSRLSLSEIWGQFMGPISKASEPYQADRLAVVRIAARGDTLQARWQLQVRQDAAMEQGDLSASSRGELMDRLAAAWAGHFAEIYAVDPSAVGEQQRLELRIDNVRSLASYAAVRSALMRMEPVDSAEPVAVRAGQLNMRLSFAGEVRTLEEYMALDRRLEPVQAPPEETGEGGLNSWLQEGQQPIPEQGGDEMDNFSGLYPTLHYRWVADSDEDREALESLEPLEEAPSGEEEAGGQEPVL